MAGNEFGPELPRSLASLKPLEKLNMNNNHISSLKNLPPNLHALHLNRNHLKDTLRMPNPLLHLAELHISGNRLAGLPDNLHLSVPMLDLLDMTDNRVEDLKLICNAVQRMKELKELNVSGNLCTPRDINGNIYGDKCMNWWYRVVASSPQVEILDDLVCTSDDVVRTAKIKKREVEVEERRAGGEGVKGKGTGKVARPKSARRKKVVVAEEEKEGGSEGSPKKAGGGSVPLVKPPPGL